MRISDWSSDVCSSDLSHDTSKGLRSRSMRPDRVQIEPAGVTLCGCTSRSQRSAPDTAHPGDDRGRGDDTHRDAYHPKAIGVASVDAVAPGPPPSAPGEHPPARRPGPEPTRPIGTPA